MPPHYLRAGSSNYSTSPARTLLYVVEHRMDVQGVHGREVGEIGEMAFCTKSRWGVRCSCASGRSPSQGRPTILRAGDGRTPAAPARVFPRRKDTLVTFCGMVWSWVAVMAAHHPPF